MPHIVSVLVPTPKQSHLPDALSYWAEEDLAPGTLVKVPLGTRVVLGIVWREASSGLERAAVKRKIELKSIAVGSIWWPSVPNTTNAPWAKWPFGACPHNLKI